MLPHTSKKISKIIRDEDPRGSIISLINDIKVSNISIITSFPKTFRSNHLHKKDWHYMYVLDGIMEYFFKKNNKIFYIKLKKGDLVFTPPKELHATYFPIKTKLIVSSGFPRDQETYENDTVRVNFINNGNLFEMLKTGQRC